MLHLQNFLSTSSNPDVQESIRSLPALHSNCALLIGPERSGKTSLLFHVAYSLASQGLRIVIVTSRTKLDIGQPLLPEGVSEKDLYWKNVDMKYIENGSDLIKYASLLHVAQPPPHAILIDNLSYYNETLTGPKSQRDMRLCHLLATLKDAIDYISRVHSSFLVVADSSQTPEFGHSPLFMCQRWLPLVLSIKEMNRTKSYKLTATLGGIHQSAEFRLGSGSGEITLIGCM